MGVRHLSGEGLETKDVAGVSQGGGRWPGRSSYLSVFAPFTPSDREQLLKLISVLVMVVTQAVVIIMMIMLVVTIMIVMMVMLLSSTMSLHIICPFYGQSTTLHLCVQNCFTLIVICPIFHWLCIRMTFCVTT